MEVLVPYLLAAAFLFFAYLLWRLALTISNRAVRRRILSYGRASEEAVAALLSTSFGAGNVLTNRWLPYRTKNGTAYTEIDCLVLLKGTIAVIEVKSLKGTIRNPEVGMWHQSAAMPDGERKELDFISPLAQNDRHIAALVGVFEKEKLEFRPDIEGFVIFTSRQVTFTYPKQDGIYTLPETAEALRRLNRQENAFTLPERMQIRRAIRKNSVSPRRAAAVNAKMRRA